MFYLMALKQNVLRIVLLSNIVIWINSQWLLEA